MHVPAVTPARRKWVSPIIRPIPSTVPAGTAILNLALALYEVDMAEVYGLQLYIPWAWLHLHKIEQLLTVRLFPAIRSSGAGSPEICGAAWSWNSRTYGRKLLDVRPLNRISVGLKRGKIAAPGNSYGVFPHQPPAKKTRMQISNILHILRNSLRIPQSVGNKNLHFINTVW